MTHLFIRGWNTYNTDLYINIFNIFKENNIEYYDFQYKNNFILDDIIFELKKLLKEKEFTTIVCHSMGAYFVSRIIQDISNIKIILLNPFIYIDNLRLNIFSKILNYKFIRNFPFYFPKWFVINKAFLSYKQKQDNNLLYDIVFESYQFICVNLLSEIVNDINNSDIIDNLFFYKKKNNNKISIIWSLDEELIKLDYKQLIRLDTFFDLNIIIGKHESFHNNEYDYIKINYLNNFKKLLFEEET